MAGKTSYQLFSEYINTQKNLQDPAVIADLRKMIQDIKTAIDLAQAAQMPLTTKGDLITYSTEPVRLPVGTDRYVPFADASTDIGIAWKDPIAFLGLVTTALLDGKIFIGNASNLATAVTPSGDWTITNAGVSTISNNAVSNAKLADMATQTFKGRTTAGTGDPEDLTATQATALLNVFTTALKGLVPASGSAVGNFLRDDGTWVAVSLTRTVQHYINSTNDTMTDGATLYMGARWGSNGTAVEANVNKEQVIVTGTITEVFYSCRTVVPSTTEAVTIYLRELTNAGVQVSETLLSNTVTYNAISKVYHFTGLSISVTKGNSMSVKIVNPTYVTNPVQMDHHFQIPVTY